MYRNKREKRRRKRRQTQSLHFQCTHTHTHLVIFMVRRDGMAVRKERIQQITKWVLRLLSKSENGEISLLKTMAILEYDTGSRPERLTEYLQVGVKTEKFVIDEDNDKIISMKKVLSDG